MPNRTIKKPGAQKITKTTTKTKQNILKTHKSKKSYPSTTRSRGTTPTVITLEILNEIISRELPKIKELELDAMTAKIAGIKTTELGQTQQKDKPTREYIKNLVSALLTTYSTQTNNLRSKKIPEFVPPNGNYKDDVCITSKYNLKKLETSGRGAFGQVYKFKSGKKTLAVKVIDISRVNENTFMKCWGGWSQYYTVEQMEKEAAISKHLGELGIGPKIHDVFYCMSTAQPGKKRPKKVAGPEHNKDGEKNNEDNPPKESKLKYYFVMDYMNRGSLQDYMDANDMKVLPEKYIKQIIAKLEKMHAAGYIHDDLHTGNILVNEPQRGQLEFYISDFGLSNKLSAKLSAETQDLYDTLKYDGNRQKKTLELQLDYFTKLILNQYSVPVLGQ